MFDRILNMPLDYFSCLVLVLRWMLGKFDICQTDYSVHSNLKISLYSEVINGSTTFKLMEDQQTLKKNDQLLSLMVLFFLSFSLFRCPLQKVLSIEVMHPIFYMHAMFYMHFLHAKQWHMCWCSHATACIKWRKLNTIPYSSKACLRTTSL